MLDAKGLDYKEMYLHLTRETEKAVRILIEAQQRCEEMYLLAENQDQERNLCIPD